MNIVGVLERHVEDKVSFVTFRPDGRMMAFLSDNSQVVRLWDVTNGQEVRRMIGHEYAVWSMAFSPDGYLMVSGSGDFTLRLWDVATERKIWKSQTLDIRAVAFSPDGTLIASAGSGDAMARLWDATDGTELQRLDGDQCPMYSIVFSPDGKHLIMAGEERAIVVWNVAEKQQSGVLEGHEGAVYSVVFSPDGTLLASGGKDGSVRLWDIATMSEVRSLTGHYGAVYSVAFSPDGTLLATGSYDRTLRLWDVASGEQVQQLGPYPDSVATVAFNARGTLLATGSGDEMVRLWAIDMPEDEWKHIEQAWSTYEEQRQKWIATFRCEVCGRPLRFRDRMILQKRCKRHRT